MKNILIPTDFSDNAYNALLYATQLFKNEPSKFYLLYSFEDEVSMLTSRVDIGRSEMVIDDLFKRYNQKLTELKHAITLDTEGFGHRYEIVASSKMLTREINFLIKGMSIDYVIMGTKGLTGAKEVLLGSTTVHVIKKIKDCPLLVIPEEIDYKPLKRIAFATGFEYPYSDFEIDAITKLADIDNAMVQIVHIREDEKIALDQREHLFQLKEKLAGVQSDICWLTPGDSKTAAITDFVFSNPVDVLAMIYYKHGFIKGLFRESIVKKVGLHPGIPFLMVPSSS
ncbi:MAG: universal stress protein [Bacteroidota bacterium]